MKKKMCAVFLISICSFLLKAAAPPRPIAPKPIAGTSAQKQGLWNRVASPVINFLKNSAINKQQAVAAKAEKNSLVNGLNSSTVPMTLNPLAIKTTQVTSQATSRTSGLIEPYNGSLSPQQLANRPLPPTPPPLNTVKVPGTPAGVYDSFAAVKAPAGKPVSTENSVYVTLPPVRLQQPASSNVNYAELSFKGGSQRKPEVIVPTTQYATIQQPPKVEPVYQNSAANPAKRQSVGAQSLYSVPKKTKKTSNV